jgi:hypothetical protein
MYNPDWRKLMPDANEFVRWTGRAVTPTRAHFLGALFQLREFRLGFEQDWNIRLGRFPECEEIIAGGGGFGRTALQHVGSRMTDMRERAGGFIPCHPAMAENSLEFGSTFASVISR